jgi:hypothetical protein
MAKKLAEATVAEALALFCSSWPFTRLSLTYVLFHHKRSSRVALVGAVFYERTMPDVTLPTWSCPVVVSRLTRSCQAIILPQRANT